MGEQVQEPALYAYPPTRVGSYLIWGHEGPRCFHSPSWHQVTADCGRGPVLQETPAAAPTGWRAWRCCCGDWWPWKSWPHRGLGCNALMGGRNRHRRFVLLKCCFLQLQQLCRTARRQRQSLLWATPPSLQPTTCSLTPSAEGRANKHTDPSTGAICRGSAKATNCTHAFTAANPQPAHKRHWRCAPLHQWEDSPMVQHVARY